MAATNYQQRDPRSLNARKSSITLPAVVPRSQYASNNRSNDDDKSTVANNVPRNFSSPYRPPLDARERHESFIQHQISITSIYSNDSLPVPGFTPHEERSSYSFFGPGPAVERGPSASSSEPAISKQSSSVRSNGVVRQASIGHKAKPALTIVSRFGSLRDRRGMAERETPSVIDPSTLGSRSDEPHGGHDSREYIPTLPDSMQGTQPIRSSSPSSTYSQEAFQHGQRLYLSPVVPVEHLRGMSPISETSPSPSPSPYDDGRVSPLPRTTPHSERSMASTNPLLTSSAGKSKHKSKIPNMKQPLRLDIEAVREAEARGSMTSLPDLIRRATRLAANLDHGRTASTLSVFDLFKSYDRAKLGNRRSAHSDVTDMLAAFPKPTAADSTQEIQAKKNRDKSEGEVFVSEVSGDGLGHRKRRCCGLSTFSVIAIVVVVILLCAAAVLVPIFLIAVPKQHRHSSDLSKCSSTFPCQNGGISIVDNNACSCVCVNGFTSNDCSTAADPTCTTNDITADTQQYHNATMGHLIGTVLFDSNPKFGIPLNGSVLLSVFAKNNITCAGEDSLVKFSTDSQNRRKLMVRSLGSEPHSETDLKETLQDERPMLSASKALPTLQARQTDVQTSNDIVYQATSTQVIATTRAVTSASTPTAAPANGSNTTSTANATSVVTPDQLEFAQVVVLYVLGASREPGIAVTAQQVMEQYFRAGALASGNDTVDVMNGEKGGAVANFAQLALVLGDGQVVGGHVTGT